MQDTLYSVGLCVFTTGLEYIFFSVHNLVRMGMQGTALDVFLLRVQLIHVLIAYVGSIAHSILQSQKQKSDSDAKASASAQEEKTTALFTVIYSHFITFLTILFLDILALLIDKSIVCSFNTSSNHVCAMTIFSNYRYFFIFFYIFCSLICISSLSSTKKKIIKSNDSLDAIPMSLSTLLFVLNYLWLHDMYYDKLKKTCVVNAFPSYNGQIIVVIYALLNVILYLFNETSFWKFVLNGTLYAYFIIRGLLMRFDGYSSSLVTEGIVFVIFIFLTMKEFDFNKKKE